MNALTLADFPEIAIDEEGDLRGVTVRRVNRMYWQFQRPDGSWSFPELRKDTLKEINES